jgi:hypothetical protein
VTRWRRLRVGRTVVGAGVGLAAVAAYLLLAMVSGRLSPLARRPLLDGFRPPPAYRWVSPPPDLAGHNQRPASGSARIHLDPGGSAAAVFATSDAQATLVFPARSFPVMSGASAVTVRVDPIAPPTSASVPTGLRIAGNVYRITATYVPSGGTVTSLRQPGQLTLFYPASPDTLLHKHWVLASPDGKTWTRLPTTDSPSQQLATANIRSLGQFAVGESASGTKAPFPVGRVVYYAILGLLAAGLVFLFVRTELRLRRRAGKKRT